MRTWLPLLLGLVAALVLWGCSENGIRKGPPARRDIAIGDRQKDWALVYYQSYLRDHNADYLRLARQQMADAVKTYFAVQVRIGFSYPDFYTVDDKRLEGCRYLDTIDHEALRHSITLNDTARVGCLR